ncbi:4-phosphoerythronate dehydrogenase [Simiduia curdlanivorans]|uniref:Erythronate-4-phosphate dehydrogenase n=1 Tax=Simiduia curdlanivorans TaxID=1492769 RepID=A0ABV8V212_9GAMM|nr:4-phosphoerythronate dehydrogenase [Simiduia curdlanivorans]MDN3640162.1 4-phosphoerythronate dehydrogenase [Simiduia curdlanivorans]
MKPLILVDENIPEAELYFGPLGRVQRFAGRNLSARDIGDAKALIVRSVTKVDASLLSASQVEFVGTCTIGTDHVDQQWLVSQGLGFSSAPGCNANSVVEYVIAALAYAEVDWQNLSFGIIGCGNVGGSVYRALSSLGADVMAYDPLIDQQAFPNMGSLSQVLTRDVICIHAPLTRVGEFPTHHVIAEAELMQLKPGALLISAGRGAVVDNEALLTVKKLRPDVKLVLDVWAHEPWVCPALLAQVIIGTPHIAGYSWDGKVTGTRMIAEALAHFWGGTVPSEAELGAAVSNQLMPLPMSSDAWQQVREAILQSYNIAGDDQRLRAMVAKAQGKEEIERGFDVLRRHYPERREFRFSQPIVKPADPAAIRCLETLGFSFL